MAHALLVDDGFWEVLERLLPERLPQRTGRPPRRARAAFTAIVFVLVTGIAWRHVPRELGCSGVTAWRRLRDWQQAGVWEQLHATLVERLNAAGAIDWSAAVVDGSHIRALQGGPNRARRVSVLLCVRPRDG